MVKARLHQYNTHPIKSHKHFVLYWMQSTQRINDNFSLEAAIKIANKHSLPLKVLFVLNGDYPDSNARHFHFMIEGLRTLATSLADLGIDFTVKQGAFNKIVPQYFEDAAAFIFDHAYLRPLRQVRTLLTNMADDEKLYALSAENDVIVPIEKASQKCEYAARTIRPKLTKVVDDYLELNEPSPLQHSHKSDCDLLKQDTQTINESLGVDVSIGKTPYFNGGEEEALKQLDHFIDEKLNHYHNSNDPAKQLTSQLSMYLHFGMISPMRIYQSVEDAMQAGSISRQSGEAYLEQLLVRRELAFNYVTYCEGYDTFETMSDPWAYETMNIHINDKRDYLYTKEDYITFNTHDPYFNAAMREMVETGYMHNYMRMYWGKKIIEWSQSYKEAYQTILTLNNAYFLDGRDPVSYASVAWLFGKHDHGWKERDILGKLRYMNDKGLKRKFDIDTYVKYCNQL